MSVSTLTDITQETNTLLVESAMESGKRSIAFVQSVWNIVLRPIAASDVEAATSELFDRASKLADVTIAEFESAGKRAMDLGGKLVVQAEKTRDASFDLVRATAQTGATRLDEMVEAAKVRSN